jgi:hypothetical protein
MSQAANAGINMAGKKDGSEKQVWALSIQSVPRFPGRLQ